MGRLVPHLLAAVALAGGVAMAQANERLYDVEVVIFSQQHGDLVEERWPSVWEPAVFSSYAEVVPEDSPTRERFRQLARDQLRLGEAARRLDDSDRYSVLLHAGWQQPGLERASAPAVTVPLGSPPPAPALETERGEDNGIRATLHAEPGLSGYLRVIVERHIHLEANLRLLDPSLEVQRRQDHLPLLRADSSPVIVMNQFRQMRSGELHYLDHSILGILVRVDRADR